MTTIAKLRSASLLKVGSIWPIMKSPMKIMLIDIQLWDESCLLRKTFPMRAVARMVPPFSIWWMLATNIVRATFIKPTLNMSMIAGMAKYRNGTRYGKSLSLF